MWGDMNHILIDNMNVYKSFVEHVDPVELKAARERDRETLREGNREFWEDFRVRPGAVLWGPRALIPGMSGDPWP